MCALTYTSTIVATKFKKWLFTVNKPDRKFSAIAIEHPHEESNAIVKGEGGAVGHTENLDAIRRWMLSAREIA